MGVPPAAPLIGPRGGQWANEPFTNCKYCPAREQPAGFCYACLSRAEIDPMAQPRCPICQLPLESDARCGNPLCSSRSMDRTFGHIIASTMLTQRMADVVHNLKPRAETGKAPKVHYGDVLAGFLAGFVESHPEAVKGYEVIVPMPSHPERVTELGVDIPARLVARLQLVLGSSIADYALPPDQLIEKVKRVEARSTGNSWQERRDAVKGAYRLLPGSASRLDGRRVLLVDDVFTTGFNLNSAAGELLAAGAAAVDALVAARVPAPAPVAGDEEWDLG